MKMKQTRSFDIMSDVTLLEISLVDDGGSGIVVVIGLPLAAFFRFVDSRSFTACV